MLNQSPTYSMPLCNLPLPRVTVNFILVTAAEPREFSYCPKGANPSDALYLPSCLRQP